MKAHTTGAAPDCPKIVKITRYKVAEPIAIFVLMIMELNLNPITFENGDRFYC